MSSKNAPWSRSSAWFLAAILICGCLTLSGCDDSDGGLVLSIQPSFTDADLEFDPDLVGTWLADDGTLKVTFAEGEKRTYSLVVTELDAGKQSSGEFEAHLVRLGSDWFIDFFPTSLLPSSEFLQMHLLRAHSIARLELRQDSIHLAFLSGSWLKQQIKQQVVDVSYQDAQGTLLLTGTTDEIQRLIHLHADEGAFSDEAQLNRQEENQ
jgi:hypothetical protein